MKTHKKKTPADYDQFAFRCTAKEKAELLGLIDKALTKLNRSQPDGSKKILKNDIIIQVLRKGLRSYSL